MFVQQPMKMASGGIVVPHRNRSGLLGPDDRHAQQLRQRHARHRGAVTCCPSWPRASSAASRCRASRTFSSSTEEKFGPGDYRPNLFVTYWAFRAMIGLLAGPGRFRARRAVADASRADSRPALVRLVRADHAFRHRSWPTRPGWVFTEMGRQPWVVVPNPTGDQMVRLTVQQGVSDHAAGMVVLSLAVFTLAVRRAGGDLVLADAPLRRRGTTRARLRTRTARSRPTTDDVAPLSLRVLRGARSWDFKNCGSSSSRRCSSAS